MEYTSRLCYSIKDRNLKREVELGAVARNTNEAVCPGGSRQVSLSSMTRPANSHQSGAATIRQLFKIGPAIVPSPRPPAEGIFEVCYGWTDGRMAGRTDGRGVSIDRRGAGPPAVCGTEYEVLDEN